MANSLLERIHEEYALGCAHSAKWRDELYEPAARALRNAMKLEHSNAKVSMFYLGPGTRAPLLQTQSTSWRIAKLRLADISQTVLERASEAVQARITAEVSHVRIDATGGLALWFLSSARSAAVREPAAWSDAFEAIVDELPARALISAGRLLAERNSFDLAYSELVVSFTATPGLVPILELVSEQQGREHAADFRSQLLPVLARYNREALKLHVRLLSSQARAGGLVAMLVDTEKTYSDGTIETDHTFSESPLCTLPELTEVLTLRWNDQKANDMLGPAIDRRLAHWHTVKLYTLTREL